MSRVGILGGSFDPPHNAHLAMAQTALRRIPLDEVLLMPAPTPPLKDPGAVTPYAHRLEMLRLAIGDREGLRLSRLEEAGSGPSYTVDLLRRYRRRDDDEPFLILGSDSVCDLARWKEPEEILSLATLVIFARTGFPPRVPVPGDAAVVLFETPVADISSSDIRARLRAGLPVRSFLPDAVLDFVLDKRLYT
jgi:nicotinate-nucleotide adenylyltransferase